MSNSLSFHTLVGVLLLVAGSILLPIVFPNPYVLHLLIITFVYSVVALGARLIMITGQWTFGQAAFLAVGSYTSVLLMRRVGFSFWIAMPIAGLCAAVFAILIGYRILRLRGIYFSMLTLCLGEVIRTIALEWKGLTGGASGIIDVPAPNAISIGSWTLAQFSPTTKVP